LLIIQQPAGNELLTLLIFLHWVIMK